MHLAPTLIGSLPTDHVPGPTDFAASFTITPQGIWGRPSEASAERGKLALEAVVGATVEYIEHSFQQLAQIKGRLDA
jgi:creatinine amidohydrolase/Fe(II)-dependent formamide hydrolase-like protein